MLDIIKLYLTYSTTLNTYFSGLSPGIPFVTVAVPVVALIMNVVHKNTFLLNNSKLNLHKVQKIVFNQRETSRILKHNWENLRVVPGSANNN